MTETNKSTQLRYPNRSSTENSSNLPKIIFTTRGSSVEGETITETSNDSTSVVLNLPKAYTISDSFIYEEFSLNLLQSAFMQRFENDTRIESIVSDTLGPIGVGLAANLGGDTLRGLINRKRGQVFNPKQFTLFRSPTLRQFGFSFQFLPENPDEVRIVSEIIKYFRRNSYPGLSEGEIEFTIPSHFNISITSSSNIIKIPPCVCNSISTNYNQTNLSYLKDSDSFFPAEIELTLGFQEFEVITRKDIGEGDDYL